MSIAQGLDYVQAIQRLAPDCRMVDVQQNLRDRDVIYAWIGNNIARVNGSLQSHLAACEQCFHAHERQHPIQIFGLPLASAFGLDGVCNLTTQPITILVDVGRVSPPDWLSLVVHEYAHAHLASPGHQQLFATVLSHLCLGLGLEPPRDQTDALLRRWPPYPAVTDPLAFWRGQIVHW